jgi:hypothetical protein
MNLGATPAQFAATYPFKRRPGAYFMPYHGAPSYYGAPAYGVALPGGVNASPLDLAKLGAGVYAASMIRKKGIAQKVIGALGLYYTYVQGSAILAPAYVPAAPGADVDVEVGNLMDAYYGLPTWVKWGLLGGVAFMVWPKAKKLLKNPRRRNGRRRNKRRNSRSRRRNGLALQANPRRRNSRKRRNSFRKRRFGKRLGARVRAGRSARKSFRKSYRKSHRANTRGRRRNWARARR